MLIQYDYSLKQHRIKLFFSLIGKTSQIATTAAPAVCLLLMTYLQDVVYVISGFHDCRLAPKFKYCEKTILLKKRDGIWFSWIAKGPFYLHLKCYTTKPLRIWLTDLLTIIPRHYLVHLPKTCFGIQPIILKFMVGVLLPLLCRCCGILYPNLSSLVIFKRRLEKLLYLSFIRVLTFFYFGQC